MTDIDWDERYASAERLWSGQPNAALVSEASKLRRGTVLDVGCGEGADVVWLASHGWTATGLEVSGVALERARAATQEAGVSASWIHAPITDAHAGPFDLVTACYPAIPRLEDGAAERALLEAVASGGHLLFVHHLPGENDGPHHHGPHPHGDQHGSDPDHAPEPPDAHAGGHGVQAEDATTQRPEKSWDSANYVSFDTVLAAADGWTVETDEVRERHVSEGAGAHHHADRVLLLRRP